MTASISLTHHQYLEQNVTLLYSVSSSRVHLYNVNTPPEEGLEQLLEPFQQELVAVRTHLGRLIDHYHMLPVTPLLPGMVEYTTNTSYQDGAPPAERIDLCRHLGIKETWQELVVQHPHLLPLVFQRNSSPAFLKRFLQALVPGSTVQVFDVESSGWRSDAPPQVMESGHVHIVFEVDQWHVWNTSEPLIRDVISRLSVHPSQVTYAVSRIF